MINSNSKENNNNLNISYVNLNISNEESLLGDNFTCESLENFLALKKKMNMKNNFDNLYTSKSSIFFQILTC